MVQDVIPRFLSNGRQKMYYAGVFFHTNRLNRNAYLKMGKRGLNDTLLFRVCEERLR